MDFRGVLTRRIGPFPTYVWAFVIVGTVWAYYLWNHRAGSAAPSQDTSAYPVDTAPIDVSGQTGDVSGSPPPDYTGVGRTGPTNNLQWQTMVSALLIAEGKPPGLVFNALTKFLQGAPLTPDEAAIRDRAIQLLNIPPEGAEQSPTIKPPPVGSPSPPGSPIGQPSDYLGPGMHRIGVIGRTYTMRSIAVRATLAQYRSNPMIVETVLRRIVAVNPHLRGKTTVPGGTVVIIPPGKGTSS